MLRTSVNVVVVIVADAVVVVVDVVVMVFAKLNVMCGLSPATVLVSDYFD